jgi:hypothetical protein
VEPRPKPIVRHRTHSLDQSLPSIGELMKHGQITLGNMRPVGCVAVAHDGRQTVSMLLRREGETVTPSVVTLKPANGGQGKTGQRRWPGLCCSTLQTPLLALCANSADHI